VLAASSGRVLATSGRGVYTGTVPGCAMNATRQRQSKNAATPAESAIERMSVTVQSVLRRSLRKSSIRLRHVHTMFASNVVSGLRDPETQSGAAPSADRTSRHVRAMPLLGHPTLRKCLPFRMFRETSHLQPMHGYQMTQTIWPSIMYPRRISIGLQPLYSSKRLRAISARYHGSP